MRIFGYPDLAAFAGTERIILESAAHDDFSALISSLVYKAASDNRFKAGAGLDVAGTLVGVGDASLGNGTFTTLHGSGFNFGIITGNDASTNNGLILNNAGGSGRQWRLTSNGSDGTLSIRDDTGGTIPARFGPSGHSLTGTVSVSDVVNAGGNGFATASAATAGAGLRKFSIPVSGDSVDFGVTGPSFVTALGWLDANRPYIYSAGSQIRIGGYSNFVGMHNGALSAGSTGTFGDTVEIRSGGALQIRPLANDFDFFAKVAGSGGASTARLEIGPGLGVGAASLSIGGNLIGTNSVRPGVTNATALGEASFAWSGGHIVTAWTVTSDARQKKLRGKDGGPTEAERAWARAIRSVAYQLKDSVAEKGDEARFHWGVFAQDVHQAGLDAGVEDPFRQGFLGCDPLFETVQQPVTIERQKVEIVTEIERAIEMRDGRAIVVEKKVEREQPLFEDKPLFDEDGEPVMVERPKTEKKSERCVEIREGKPVLFTREIDVPLIEQAPLRYANGRPVMIDAEAEASPILAADGQPARRRAKRVQATHAVPVMERVQATQRVPVMETVEVMQPVQVPVMEDGEQVKRWNIRYTELVMFLLACGALGGVAE